MKLSKKKKTQDDSIPPERFLFSFYSNIVSNIESLKESEHTVSNDTYRRGYHKGKMDTLGMVKGRIEHYFSTGE